MLVLYLRKNRGTGGLYEDLKIIEAPHGISISYLYTDMAIYGVDYEASNWTTTCGFYSTSTGSYPNYSYIYYKKRFKKVVVLGIDTEDGTTDKEFLISDPNKPTDDGHWEHFYVKTVTQGDVVGYNKNL